MDFDGGMSSSPERAGNILSSAFALYAQNVGLDVDGAVAVFRVHWMLAQKHKLEVN